MAHITKEEVAHIAELARIGMSEKEAAFYAEELSAVLDYVEELDTVDVSAVEPMNHATGLHSVAREDDVSLLSAEERDGLAKRLMDLVPFTHNGLAKVREVFKREENNGDA